MAPQVGPELSTSVLELLSPPCLAYSDALLWAVTSGDAIGFLTIAVILAKKEKGESFLQKPPKMLPGGRVSTLSQHQRPPQIECGLRVSDG